MAGIAQLPFNSIEELGLLVDVKRRPRLESLNPNEEGTKLVLFLFRIAGFCPSLFKRKEPLDLVGNLLSESNSLTGVEPRTYHSIDWVFTKSKYSHFTGNRRTQRLKSSKQLKGTQDGFI